MVRGLGARFSLNKCFIHRKVIMVELLYFSGLGLMVKVEHVKKTNSLSYASHRMMDEDEKAMTEQFILAQVAKTSAAHIKCAPKVSYLGTDERLKKRLTSFQEKAQAQSSRGKKKEIDSAVNKLISTSMRDYYSERIGELLMSARSELKGDRQHEAKLANIRQQMNDLLTAYNTYADQKITLGNVIPTELKPFWTGLEETQYKVAP